MIHMEECTSSQETDGDGTLLYDYMYFHTADHKPIIDP